jgi:hypothetical protein
MLSSETSVRIVLEPYSEERVWVNWNAKRRLDLTFFFELPLREKYSMKRMRKNAKMDDDVPVACHQGTRSPVPPAVPCLFWFSTGSTLFKDRVHSLVITRIRFYPARAFPILHFHHQSRYLARKTKVTNHSLGIRYWPRTFSTTLTYQSPIMAVSMWLKHRALLRSDFVIGGQRAGRRFVEHVLKHVTRCLRCLLGKQNSRHN